MSETNSFERLMKKYGIIVRRSSISPNKRKLKYPTRKREAIVNYMPQKETNEKIVLGASDITDYIIANIIDKRNDLRINTDRESFGIYCTKNEWKIFKKLLGEYRILDYDTTAYFFDDEGMNYFEANLHSTHVSISVVGSMDFIHSIVKKFKDSFDFVKNEIEWIYSNDGTSIDIPLQNERMPIKEMYPFLGDKLLEEYYDEFMKSSASILLLLGPPGTGKTTFIRGLLQHTNSSASLTYDAGILEKDYVFAGFVEGEKNVLVLEDADMFLKSRKEGNTVMHKFLNVGDGLVTMRGKKMIFSTNLPSIKDIDPALIRPGRCFDVLHFQELNQKQAEALASKVGIQLKGKRDKWTVADVFFETKKEENSVKGNKMGFV